MKLEMCLLFLCRNVLTCPVCVAKSTLPWRGALVQKTQCWIIFQVLSGLLHLGNIQFSNPVDEAQPCELEDKTKGEATSTFPHLSW